MKGAITSPVIQWSAPTDSAGMVEWQYGSSANVDADPYPEVIMGSYGSSVRRAKLYCLSGLDGTRKWTRDFISSVRSTPVVADVDNDGAVEIIVSDYGENLYCLRGSDGSEKWSFAPGTMASPNAADLDGDGVLEVFFGTYMNGVYCLSGLNGTPIWNNSSIMYCRAGPAVADCDGDLDLDVVIAANDTLYCLEGSNGTRKWARRIGSLMGDLPNYPVIYDCDQDGKAEVIAASTNGVIYCFAGTDGGTKWSFSTGGAIIYSSPGVADLDADGQIEVVIGTMAPSLYCLRGTDGTQKWVKTGFPAGIHCQGAIVDVDGNDGGKLEIMLSQDDLPTNTLICVNGEDGSILWSMGGFSTDVHSPFAADIDLDGCIEIVFGLQDAMPDSSRIFAIDDPNNTQGCSPLYEGEKEEDIMKEKILLEPRGKGIYLFMPATFHISLTLYDASGRLIQNLYNGVLTQGAHTFNPGRGGLELTKGVCFAVLKYQGGTKVLKVIE
ncbi:MAG: PQQ-binding-like beta-propeller repeat protein [candidate division WOR-3 bacterium]